MMKLYDMELSGNCYKIRLLCGLLGIDYERVPVDLMQGQHKSEDFLRLNPRGQIPVLEDAGVLIWDSSAILLYLARQYGGEQWLPLAAKPMAEVMQWLSLAQNELLYGLARARAAKNSTGPGMSSNASNTADWACKCWNGNWRLTPGWPAASRPLPISLVILTWPWRRRAVWHWPSSRPCWPGCSVSGNCPDTSPCRESAQISGLQAEAVSAAACGNN